MRAKETLKLSGIWSLAALLGFSVLFVPAVAAAVEPSGVGTGDSVYVAPGVGYGGTLVHPIYATTPADPANPGQPDLWAYCIEHDISVKTKLTGLVGDFSDYLGANLFASPTVQAKVLWVLANSYPAMSLAGFGAASGVPGISQDDAIEATQYAIWRYADMGYDAAWSWQTIDSENAYLYLVGGANASSGLQLADVHPTVSVTGPSTAQVAETLVGPFVISTDRPTVSVVSNPAVALVDAAGTAIDATAVVDGQEVYLDLRGVSTSGTATVTGLATGSSSTGRIISVPTVAGGTATAGSHAQSLILVTPDTTQTSSAAAVTWAAVPVPTIGTTLVDAVDSDHTIAASGGTVTDTVAYDALTPGTAYTISGELMRKSDGSSTGITGSTNFTPTTASGSVEVDFVVGSGFAGQSLVAFESLFEVGNATAVAEHHDINDAAQTVAVQAQQTSPTQNSSTQNSPAQNGPGGTSSSQGPNSQLAVTGAAPLYGSVAAAVVALALGAALILLRRRPRGKHV